VAVWPFGEAVHYTDAREGASSQVITTELRAYVESTGLAGVTIEPIAASIEDAFMWYMAQDRAA
jgi:hypothetical protein